MSSEWADLCLGEKHRENIFKQSEKLLNGFCDRDHELSYTASCMIAALCGINEHLKAFDGQDLFTIRKLCHDINHILHKAMDELDTVWRDHNFKIGEAILEREKQTEGQL